jgi:hypothetical protein
MTGLVLVAFGLLLLWANRRQIGDGLQSMRWHAVKARVCETAMHVDPSQRNIPVSLLLSQNRRLYRLEYHVAGADYTWTSEPFTSAPHDLMTGDRVTIFYDPANPERAAFRRGIPLRSLIGLVVISAGGYVAWKSGWR